jgi:low temperature requirement protein LtrA
MLMPCTIGRRGGRQDAMTVGFSRNLLRPGSGERSRQVTFVELFFDLVFVFAVTQVSHILIDHANLASLLYTVMLTVIVWWVWVDTAWVTNWLDPERGWVRGMLIVIMLLGLLMSSAIPHSFSDQALLFALSLAAIQIGRSTFTALAFARRRADSALNFVRISIWHTVTGALWIFGAVAGGQAQVWIWLVALLLASAAPRSYFWVPGLGRSSPDTWDVSGEHMAERVSLFIIIALGESIIVSGATFSTVPFEWPTVLAFLAVFANTALMWLLYFNHSQEHGSDYIAEAAQPGLIARLAYTYVPVVLVIGIVFSAVADHVVLLHPLEENTAWGAGLICGASAIYLLGNALFKRAIGDAWHISNLVGIVVLAGLFASYPVVAPAAMNWLSNAVLLAAVIVDEQRFRRRQTLEVSGA